MKGDRRAMRRPRLLRLTLLCLLWVFLLAACKPATDLADAKPERPEIVGPMVESVVMTHSEAYKEGRAGYEPDPAAVGAIAMMQTPVEIDVIFGTWCSDSEREVPHFLKILDRAGEGRLEMGLGELPISVSFVAVDREKVEPVGEIGEMGIEKVPTFILRVEGTEFGRIVETPEGLLEEDLARRLLDPFAPPPEPPAAEPDRE